MEPCRIQQGDGGPVDNPLGTYVHIRAGGHLSVLGNPQGVEPFVLLPGRIVGNHHAVGNHHTGGFRVRGEESQGMPRIHHQGLLITHLRKVLHGEQVLGPVLKHRPVSTVSDQLMGVLRHRRIQVVLDHQHDGCRLRRPGGIGREGTGLHLIVGPETVHVNPAVQLQLLHKFRSKHPVKVRRKITQGIPYCQLLFFRGKNLPALRCMVHPRIIGLLPGKNGRNPFPDGPGK